MQSNIEIGAKLSRLCNRIFGSNGEVDRLQRLTGGASAQSWYFEYDDIPYIMRREEDENPLSEALSLNHQADIMTAAYNKGLKVPQILGKIEQSDALGHGFIMEYTSGEALPHKIFKTYEDTQFYEDLLQQCAVQLASIHSLPLSETLRHDSPMQMLQNLKQDYQTLGAKLPIFDWAFLTLEQQCPEAGEAVFLHGDFRMGNLMIDEAGISAVLDWELCHVGDAEQDLAYMCAPSWRFGHYENPVGGFGKIDDFINHYESISGCKVDRVRFDFWLIFSTLWWGIVCLRMLDSWRTETERTLERAVIGTRVSEVELDLVLLLEGDAPVSSAVRDWERPQRNLNASGATKASELIRALYEWDEGVIETAKGRDLFEARVAKNALAIVERSAQFGALFVRKQRERMQSIANLSEDNMAQRAASGDCDVINHLRLCALEKTTIDQPHYAAVKVAQRKWQNTPKVKV